MIRVLTLAAAAAFAIATLSAPASAQSLRSVRTPAKPLILKARGSFYVGGETVEATATELGIGVADRVTINQMYVDFMVPAGRAKLPVILVHGAGLSGKSYDTTPDGRPGWFEHMVRQGHATYVVDQVGRARSGFNHITLNQRLMGASPATPTPASPTAVPGGVGGPGGPRGAAFRFGERYGVWTNFRFGPRPGEAFPGEQFPTEAVGELAKQSIPDLSSLVPQPNPTLKNLASLAVDLDGAVLVGHSQSGAFPLEAALVNAAGLRALVAVEPGGCRPTYTDAQIAALAKVPTLILFGDNLPNDTGMGPNSITWQNRYDGCVAYSARIRAVGGKVEVIKTTDLGIRGNSHMLMQDSNSDQIADMILKWVDANARKTGA
jgi:pimeloyl-ACP methyl ester carboxylesterase